MKYFVLNLMLLFCIGICQSQTIFNPNDAIVNYNGTAPAGSAANPYEPGGYNIAKWVRTPLMPWNTDRYKCYIIGNIPFRLRYPDSYQPGVNDGKKYPVMLFLHGGGEATTNTRDNEFQLINGGLTFQDKIFYGGQDAFILFPQSKYVGWDNSYFVPMNIVIDSLVKNCKADEDRIIPMGLSIGGIGAINYAIAFPQRASTIIANAPVQIGSFFPVVTPAVHVPLWIGTGGKDPNPDPASAQSFVNFYRSGGGDLYWSYYPLQGHTIWDLQWGEEPNYANRMSTTHKANPLVYFNNRFFCPGSPVSSRLGITGGYNAYQWDKNGVVIPGATGNEYIATDFGVYRARFKRTPTAEWSAWSLLPAVVSPVCPPVIGNGTGLKGTYYNNVSFTPPSSVIQTDPAINFIYDFNTSPVPPIGVSNYSIRWTGQIQPQFSETYTFYTRSDDGIRLSINGVQIINNFVDHGITEDIGSIALVAGQKYDIVIDYYNRNGGGVATLKWSGPSTVKQMVPTTQLYPDGSGGPAVPLCTANITPANGATIATSTTAALSWGSAATATSYDLYLWTGATAPITPTATVTTTSYNASTLIPGALYNWYVVPKNASGPATGCSVTNRTSFTTAPGAVPACIVNTAPVNGTTLGTQTTATLNWPAAATATSYDVYIWTGAVAPVSPTANTATTTYNATGLTAGTLYNWYIAPRNAGGAANNCNTANATSFTTASAVGTVPVCATNTAPVNASTIGTTTTATLSWGAVAAATSYDLYFWTGATAPVTPTAANIAATSYNATSLTAATTYNWYVVPKNATGPATGCGTSSRTTFTTAASAATGTGLQGAYFNNITLTGTPVITRIDPTVNFDFVYQQAAPGVNLENYSVRWTGQVQPLFSQTYTFYVTTDDGVRLWVNGVQLVNNWINQGATEKSGTISLVAGQRYDIVMEYYQGTGFATSKLSWSSASTVKAIIPASQLFPPGAGPTVPICTSNISPANASTVASQLSATLTWNSAATATSYDVYIWTGATAPLTPTAANIAATSYSATGLTAATSYNWYVVPKNTAGAATGCNTSNTSFVTAAAIPVPLCTVNTSPTNASTIATPNTATLTWTPAATATSYDIYIWTGATAPLTPTAANIAATSYSATGLTAATSYNWYVVPKNTAGAATGCNTSSTSFVTAAAIPVPLCTVNTSPVNAATIATATTAVLTWNAAATATSYDVYLWTGATAPVTPTANTGTTSYSATGLTAATLYSWYVVPRNASGPATGCAISSRSTFTTAASAAAGTGLQGVYYNNITLTGTPVITRIDPTINFDFVYQQSAPGVNLEFYSVRWSGQVKPVFSETYTFYVTTDDGVRLWVNGVQLVNNWVNQGATERSGTITLVAVQRYDIVMEYYQGTGFAVSKLLWSSASTAKAIIPRSQLYPPGAAARIADAALQTQSATLQSSVASQVPLSMSSTINPNPVSRGQSARLQINSDKTGVAMLNIINNNGLVISQQRLTLVKGINNTMINTSLLGQGFYIINITGGTKTVSSKLLIK